MQIDSEKIYVILDIHPRDAYHEFRKELIGQRVMLEDCSPSKIEDGDFIYCHATFVSPVVTENIYLSEVIFSAVRIGDPNAEHEHRNQTQTEASEDR